MNIELTALEAGSLVFFSIAIVGMVMALRLRSRRKKKRQVKQDEAWKESKWKESSPEKVPEKPQQSEPSQEPEKPKHDVDALLDDLKKDSEKE